MLCIEYADDDYKWYFHNKTNYINNILSHLKKWELKSLPILYSNSDENGYKICY